MVTRGAEMKKMLLLNTLRSVKNTKSRFIAIMAIIAIGSGFFAGVKSAGPDLKLSARDYLEKQNLADFHIVSELGLDDEDRAAAESLGISDEIRMGYSADLMTSANDGGERIIKVYSYNGESGINKPYVTEGRLPEKAGEIFLDENILGSVTGGIGGEMSFHTGDDRDMADILEDKGYTVVGKGLLPVYVSFERGSATIGNGSVDGWALICEADFTYEVYTDMYISISEANGIDPYSEEYAEIIERNTDVLEAFADVQIEHRKGVITDEAYEEINEARADIEEGKQKLADAEQELADGKKELEDGEKEIADGWVEIEKAEAELEDAIAELQDGEVEYNDGIRQLETIKDVAEFLDGVIAHYAANVGTMADIEDIEKDLQYDFFAVDDTLKQLLMGYILTPAEYDDGTKAMSKQGLEMYVAELEKTVSENEVTLAAAKVEIDSAWSEIENVKEEILSAKTDLAEGQKELADGEAEIADAEAKIADAKQEIADGEQELADAEAELAEELDGAEMYVFDRDFNPAYANYAEDCERVDAIAAVFPIFFILVAALVCCTTMTRMVEEQRTQIGTLKALGYSRFSIIFQYVLYSLTASVIGTAVGLAIGFNTIPKIVYDCYHAMYNQPYFLAPFRWDYAVGCVIAASLCTSLSALFASRQELVSCPAQLMRPKPPKDGKRILLERITFIWKRMKFTTKVTFRNLFRYKARLMMTVIGIAGCTALLLTGFGLHYAITSIVDKQYGGVFLYDSLVVLDTNAAESEIESASRAAVDTGIISEQIFVMQETADVMSSDGEKVECYMLVTEDAEGLNSFIDMHDRRSGEKYTLSDGGVIIGEKISRMFGVDAGDEIYFTEGYPLTVEAVCENYTMNYVFMTRAAYDRAGFADGYKANMLLQNMSDLSREDELSTALVKEDAVLAVELSSHGGDKFRDLVNSLSMVIVVVIVAAGALAFVVLFNLSNININERVRELATIKVLGFYDGEVASYVYRENVLLTIMGTAAGLLLGIVFERFVVQTAEVDSVMFAPEIPLYAFAEAAAMTILFSVLVNITLYFRLKKIDMATSLKAIE